jgi:3-deoxy-D-manno-octulosonic-acid transferase
MSLTESLYGVAVSGLRALAPLAAWGSSKVARGVRGRRGAVVRFQAWTRTGRDPGRPLVWFHAPSVGEGLQARAVLEALLHRRPDVQTAFTHFSPSAEALADAMPADVADYLPWDTRREMSRALTALAPSLVAFTKTEVWPGLSRAAAAREIPTALVAASLPPTSSRQGGLARALLGPSYRRLSRILAVAGEDAERLERLGARPDAVQVSGDPGIDSAAERALAADPAAPALAPFHAAPAPTLVAGSTWKPDEDVLLPAVTGLRREVRGLRLVIAPHEPTPAHVARLRGQLAGTGWRVSTLGQVEDAGEVGEADAVVVDRVGVLAHLYTVGSVAYVGGGFHDDGLHSVLEPAAARLPVAFGPRHRNARAAGDLVGRGGGAVVRDVDQLRAVLGAWLADPGRRAAASAAAYAYIRSHLGAADRSAAMLETLLPDARSDATEAAPGQTSIPGGSTHE